MHPTFLLHNIIIANRIKYPQKPKTRLKSFYPKKKKKKKKTHTKLFQFDALHIYIFSF